MMMVMMMMMTATTKIMLKTTMMMARLLMKIDMLLVMMIMIMRMVVRCHLQAKALYQSPQHGASFQPSQPLKKTPRDSSDLLLMQVSTHHPSVVALVLVELELVV